ncbi:MAG: hypothetical protein ACRDYA_16745 [Egibacteraceae bacterium]
MSPTTRSGWACPPGSNPGTAHLHVYPARRAPEYQALDGICWHDRLDPHALLRALPEYDYGWAGFNAALNGAHLDTVLPNKLFEYLACGLPVLTLRHHALEQFVREHGVGLALDGLDDLGALDATDSAGVGFRVHTHVRS